MAPRTVLALLLALASPAGAIEIDAGALRASIATDPWHVTFHVRQGADLSEVAGPDAGPTGPVGFRTAAGWFHATRAVSVERRAGAVEAVLETTDADGRRLVVRVAPDAPGIIALTARLEHDDPAVGAFGIAFDASPGERFYGLGERADDVEHGGRVVESYVADGPYHPADRAIIGAIIPPQGFRSRDDATYFPVPWVLSSRGYGVLVDDDETVYHRFGTERPDAWSVEVVGAPEGVAPHGAPSGLRLRVFAGPAPADVLRRFSAAVGRQPPPAAPWVFGTWYQPGGSVADQLVQLQAERAADVPVSVSQTYFHYLPCGGDRSQEPGRTAAMHALGLAVTTYFNPMLCEDYAAVFAEAAAQGALQKTAAGDPYVFQYVTSRAFRVAQFDFTAAAGRALYQRLLGDAIADGHDGWMEDFGEYTPLDAFVADGRDGTTQHNPYPRDYHCTAFATASSAARPVVRFQRSGWTGAARCAQVVWSGDPTTDWGFDGLASVVKTGLGMGLSGVSTWGSDVGGFFGFFGKHLTGELLRRWVQLGALSPVMRTERDGLAIPAYTRPQVDDPDQLANWRRWAKLHTQLLPYLVAADEAYRQDGLPIMRHLVLGWPDDARAQTTDDEYLFGPDLLAAPVLAPGAAARDVYLPAGTWVDLWRSAAYDAGPGAVVLDGAAMVAGGTTVVTPAAADELPIFVRAGALLPLLPPDVDTLADYDTMPDVVRLADRQDEVHVLAFPRGVSRARVYRHERLDSREGDGEWELRMRGRGRRRWTVQAALGTLERPFTPCVVWWRGALVAPDDWSYDAAGRVLRVAVSGTRGRLRVRAACS